MTKLALKCQCGTVQGVANYVSENGGNRVVCYCEDCQAFARFLRNEARILDEYGGTKIFQMPLAYVKITAGIERVSCLRLTAKGMYRWYCGCCNTAIGNTLSAGVPFIGLIEDFIALQNQVEEQLGPVQAYLHTQFALVSLPEQRKLSTYPHTLMLRTFIQLGIWKIKGLNQPSSFFDAKGRTLVQPLILTNDRNT